MEDSFEVKTYQDLQDRNVQEKAVMLKALMSELHEEEKQQGLIPAVSRPTTRKRKAKPAATT